MLGSSDSNQSTSSGREQSLFSAVLGMVNNPMVIGVLGLVVGLGLGLLVGWGIWPVQWKDASVVHLRQDLQEEWVRMVVDSYGLRSTEPGTAVRRLEELGENAPAVMDTVAVNPGDEFTTTALQEVRAYYNAAHGTTSVLPGQPTATPAAGATGGGGLSGLVMACAFTVLLGVAAATVFYLRRRSRGPGTVTAAMKAQQYSTQAMRTDYESIGQEPPIAQWMTTYLKGDDLFDDSFSVDAPTGEFMGECGVGIAETIGVGEPKRVSAFEVWLFDKNDIQTVTKVLMSEHLFNDEASHNRLAAKGEPILASPGAQFALETETLQMLVRVVDMAYGEGALPDYSFFERVTLELSIWPK